MQHRFCLDKPGQYQRNTQWKKDLEALTLASNSKRTVIITGAAASGKKSLIHDLANVAGEQLVIIPMSAELEASSLIGQWTMRTAQVEHTGEKEAEMVFSYSALVQAMQAGQWVLLDGVHLAPSEVLLGGSARGW